MFHFRCAIVAPDNVLFFENKPGQEKPWTKNLWVYDLRTNKHFTLKANPLNRTDLVQKMSRLALSRLMISSVGSQLFGKPLAYVAGAYA